MQKRPGLIKRLLIIPSPLVEGSQTYKVRRVLTQTAEEAGNKRQAWIARRSEARSSSAELERSRPIRSDEDIFGLLQDIQEDLSSTTDGTAKGPDDGTQPSISTLSPLEQLPLSPLMHPQLLRARRRYTEKKPLPSKELTEFQKLLEKNPYAQQLATPVRTCMLTGARLPLGLLTPFAVYSRPPKGRLWVVPQGFQDVITAPPSAQKPSPTAPNLNNHSEDDVGAESDDESIETSNVDKSTVGSQSHITPISPPLPIRASPTAFQWTTYVSVQLSCLTYIGSLSPRNLFRVLPFRWKARFGNSMKNIVFRDDMGTFILSLYRKRLLRKLQQLLTSDSDYLIPYSQEHRKEPKQLAALIWVEPRQKIPETETESNSTAGMQLPEIAKPEAYAIVRREEESLPVFDLGYLLGTEATRRLMSSEHGFRFQTHEILGVRSKRATVDLVWQLWQLTGFLADGDQRHGLNEWAGDRAEAGAASIGRSTMVPRNANRTYQTQGRE